jgi:hypothetical protein
MLYLHIQLQKTGNKINIAQQGCFLGPLSINVILTCFTIGFMELLVFSANKCAVTGANKFANTFRSAKN